MLNILNIIWLIPLGYAVGVLINAIADTLPQERKIKTPSCQYCGVEFTPKSYFLLQVCPECTHRRSVRAWLVQILSVLITTLMWFFPPFFLGYWTGLLLLIYFGIVAVIDFEHRAILTETSWVGAAMGLAIGWELRGPALTIAGGVAGFLIMLVLYYFGVLFNRWIGKRRGQPVDEVALGFGDVTLCAIIGLILGWPIITAGILLAVLLGGIASIGVLVYSFATHNYKPLQPIAYGPYLILANIILLYILPSALELSNL